MVLECSRCGATFTRPRKRTYCSKRCALLARGWSGAQHPNYIGGKTAHRRPPREKYSWRSMHQRTKADALERFRRCYFDRGITVCDRWQVFENFLADMGPRPPGTTLERLNNDGNYEPVNCCWATAAQQGRNTRQTRLTVDSARKIRDRLASGERISALAREFGVAWSTIAFVRNGHTWREAPPSIDREKPAPPVDGGEELTS